MEACGPIGPHVSKFSKLGPGTPPPCMQDTFARATHSAAGRPSATIGYLVYYTTFKSAPVAETKNVITKYSKNFATGVNTKFEGILKFSSKSLLAKF